MVNFFRDDTDSSLLPNIRVLAIILNLKRQGLHFWLNVHCNHSCEIAVMIQICIITAIIYNIIYYISLCLLVIIESDVIT